MSVSVAQLSKFQFNWNDAPIVGGLLFTYAAGTTTKLTTYQDSFGAVPNTNPIVLDANGQCNLYLTDGLSYKFTLSPPGDTDPPTNPYWTVDNILSAAGAAGVFSTTLTPIQLLNPAGSTSGQVITSTGGSTVPVWGNPASGTVTTVSVTTANGVSGTVATPTTTPAISLTLGAITPITVAPTGAITPSTTAGIVGTTLANNANVGSVGEYVTATGTAVSLSNGVTANITSISLTAGDWNVWGNIEYDPAASTGISSGVSGINTASATLPARPMKGVLETPGVTGTSFTVAAPMTRINVSTTTTVYLVANAAFTTSTLTATGVIQARRVR